MPVSRFRTRRELINSNRMYKKYIFKDRGVGRATQYNTAVFYYPSDEELQNLTIDEHVWSMGDKYYKLAHHYYGDPEYWWVIALFNKKPADFLLNLGDVVYIPQPLEEIIGYYEV
tara:strand:- start:285 stop:629 length:345 start_codon:yes stop_codon:yes gene_type:complete